ncbi:MAG: hypothetical protein IJM76_08980 [Lachnospiraceae bacterium]|nr:hypothetical protein [Lachnospiraceae bacterium]
MNSIPSWNTTVMTPQWYNSGVSRNGYYPSDATWLNVRRDSVCKEALHLIIGVMTDGTKAKEQFPNEESLERYVCNNCMDNNRRYGLRVHRGFVEAQAELLMMFEQL